MRVLVERSGTPNTLISIRSPIPSFTLEFASVRGDWGEAVSLAGEGWGSTPQPVSGPGGEGCTKQQETRASFAKGSGDSARTYQHLWIYACVEFNTRHRVELAQGWSRNTIP